MKRYLKGGAWQLGALQEAIFSVLRQSYPKDRRWPLSPGCKLPSGLGSDEGLCPDLVLGPHHKECVCVRQGYSGPGVGPGPIASTRLGGDLKAGFRPGAVAHFGRPRQADHEVRSSRPA